MTVDTEVAPVRVVRRGSVRAPGTEDVLQEESSRITYSVQLPNGRRATRPSDFETQGP